MSGFKKIYKGQILVSTVPLEDRLEKHVYIKDSFVREGVIYVDTDDAKLVLKYDIEKIQKFIDLGVISANEGTKLKEDIFIQERQMALLSDWKEENSDASEQETIQFIQELMENSGCDEKKKDEINLALRKLIAQTEFGDHGVLDDSPKLFRTIDSEEYFAITKPIMDRIYHLPELLKNAKASLLKGDQWVIESKIDNRGTGPIGLIHDFRALNRLDAKEYLEGYRDWIRGEGLKILAAYWKTACDRGGFQFSTPIVDVMQQMANSRRMMHFSVKEREKFWAATRKLEQTKLTIEYLLPKAKRKKEQKLLIEHRLVDVGARVHNRGENTYPNDVFVKVLDPNDFQKFSQIGTAIHNNTLKLHPKDILLAMSFQIRKAQTRDQEINAFDEDYLIERANLEQTAKSNRRMARSTLQKKLKKYEGCKIIEGVAVIGKKNKKYNIKIEFPHKDKK